MDDIAPTPDESDLHANIERLEARIDALADIIEGCRKFMLASRIAIAIGVAIPVGMVLGVIAADLAVMIGAVAAFLGGIVFLGSNRSTRDEAQADMREAEAQRADLIDQIDMRLAGEGVGRTPRGIAFL
jgi:hypothetical protein